MSNPRALPGILAQYIRAGRLELPESIRQADEAHAKAVAVLDAGTPDNFMPVALDALYRGVHPLDDKKAAAVILGGYLRTINFDTQARAALDQRRADAYRSAFDECVDLWRPVFDEGAQRIAEAAEVLGDLFTSNAPAEQVLRSGADASAAWLAATEAALQLDSIVDAWNALAFHANGERGLRDPAAGVVAHDVEHWISHKPERGDKILDLARRGHRLELHHFDEVALFLEQVSMEQERRSMVAAEQRERAFTSHLRFQ